MKRTPHIVRVAAIGLTLAALALGVSACKKPAAQVTSAWPVANTERTVPQPPVAPTWPLTGMPAPSAKATQARVVSVKIENSKAARPQTGLNSADVVYETLIEAGDSRFNALFQSKTPKVVGPVRSARLSDLWIVPQYDALFWFSGASKFVYTKVQRDGLPNLSEDNGVGRPFFRSSARNAPHNLYIAFPQTRATAKARGLKITSDVPRLRFSRTPPTGETITRISVPFSSYQVTNWKYGKGDRSYTRYNGSTVNIDAGTGTPVKTRNVVVMWTKYTAQRKDKWGDITWDIDLGGSGRATLFRDGKKIDGRWVADRKNPPILKTNDGAAIKLAPGNTWYEVIDNSTNITMQ